MQHISTEAESSKLINAMVDAKPAIMYARIQKLYPQEFPKMDPGYLQTDSSRLDMKNFLNKKARNATSYDAFFQSL